MSDAERKPIRRILHASNRVFARVYHRLEVLSPCQLPSKGPAILVSNHTSGLDPLLIQSVCSRLIIWMMAKEYYDHPVLGWIYRQVEAIPVARTGRDMAAMREALRALKQGRVVGVFPEGKIEPTRELLPFQTGVALLASRSQAPVYPCFLDGTQRGQEMIPAVTHRQHATISFGTDVNWVGSGHDREQLIGHTKRLEAAVQTLSDRAKAHRQPI